MNAPVYEYPKTLPFRSEHYRKWITGKPCAKCYQAPGTHIDIVAAHQGDILGRGMGQKADDSTCLPLCVLCHHREHNEGVKTFWRGIDRKVLIIKCLTDYLKGGIFT